VNDTEIGKNCQQNTAELTEYSSLFAQRIPKYAVKLPNGSWTTKRKALSDKAIQAHLEHKYWIAALGRWYPEFSILDFDSVDPGQVEDVRSELGLDTDNSILCSSPSADSYHLMIRPSYKGKPPTLRLLQKTLRHFGRHHGIEIYPSPNQPIRLPFGKGQEPLDYEYQGYDWRQLVYWFQKLDPFELSTVPLQQLQLDLGLPERENPLISPYQQGSEYLQSGLQLPSSRHEAQFCVLYYLWRNNVPVEAAIKTCWFWIRGHHNGFSKDIRTNPRRVHEEIIRQAGHIWNKYEWQTVYPDSTHNSENGFIAKADIPDIIEAAGGNRPRAKFLFHLVKYANPRRHRRFMPVHRSKLVRWGSMRTYRQYLDEFEDKGILKRSSSYSTDRYSKHITVNWKWRNEDAILYSGRSIDTFESTVAATMRRDEFYNLMKCAGSTKAAASKAGRDIFRCASAEASPPFKGEED